RGLRTPFLRIAKDGAVVDPKRFTTSGGAGAEIADQVSSDAVLRLFAEGSTVVLQGLHRLWPPLIEFADQLAADLGHPTPGKASVTPPALRADRVRRSAGRRPGPPHAGQRLHHPAVLPRIQPALRRPRRLR